MKCLYVKDLAKASGLSIQTIRHYDKLGILRPSGRSESGYRVYSDADLEKLRTIVALRFFKFDLAIIGRIINSPSEAIKSIEVQVDVLRENSQKLLSAGRILERLVQNLSEGSIEAIEVISKLKEAHKMINIQTELFNSEAFNKLKKSTVEQGLFSEAQVNQSLDKIKYWTTQDWQEWLAKSGAISKKFSQALAEKEDPASEKVQAIVKEQYELVCQTWKPTKEQFIQTYKNNKNLELTKDAFKDDPKYKHLAPENTNIAETVDTVYGKGWTEFVTSAIEIWANKNL